MKFRNDAGASIPDSGRPSLETPCQDPRVAHNRRVSGLSVVLGACSGSRPEYASGPAKWTLAAHLPPLLMRTMQPSRLARATSLGVVRLTPVSPAVLHLLGPLELLLNVDIATHGVLDTCPTTIAQMARTRTRSIPTARLCDSARLGTAAVELSLAETLQPYCGQVAPVKSVRPALGAVPLKRALRSRWAKFQIKLR